MHGFGGKNDSSSESQPREAVGTKREIVRAADTGGQNGRRRGEGPDAGTKGAISVVHDRKRGGAWSPNSTAIGVGKRTEELREKIGETHCEMGGVHGVHGSS